MKKHVLTISSTVMTLMLSLTAFAGSWKNNAQGWWYDYDDTILWENNTISSKDKTKTVTVDISGQDEVRIHTNCEKY